jgi:hypothetical protein
VGRDRWGISFGPFGSFREPLGCQARRCLYSGSTHIGRPQPVLLPFMHADNEQKPQLVATLCLCVSS